jgi:hypothetical protein
LLTGFIPHRKLPSQCKQEFPSAAKTILIAVGSSHFILHYLSYKVSSSI